ncbi:MAG: type I restriction enzyme HsdR N-terminal domain-containing protein [Verrucomicrobia bacterium]|nr:type I restriction enzyme HsdR N-terminal domain-containing protein [Verrucomicrobiota bacterium]
MNESDTVSIIKDVLAEVFGYDKYVDLTSEFAVRCTFCDLAVKIDGKVEYLIEAKAVGLDLKENHLRQAIEYGANNGVQWVILTNGICWNVYKIRFEKPISYDLVCALDLLDLDPKNAEHQEKLFVICKEGLSKDAREEFHEKLLVVNRFILGALVLSEDVVMMIRRELRKFSDGVLVDPEEIRKVLSSEVLKRDVIEGEDAAKAQARIRRFHAKATRRSHGDSAEQPSPAESGPVSGTQREPPPGAPEDLPS